jgi:hypothetical protein
MGALMVRMKIRSRQSPPNDACHGAGTGQTCIGSAAPKENATAGLAGSPGLEIVCHRLADIVWEGQTI